MCSWESCVSSSLSSATFARRARTQLNNSCYNNRKLYQLLPDNATPCTAEKPADYSASVRRAGGRIAQMAGWRVRLPHTVAHTIATWNPTLEFLWQRWELVGAPRYQHQAPFKHNDGSKRCSVAVTCGWEMWDKNKILMKNPENLIILIFFCKTTKAYLSF